MKCENCGANYSAAVYLCCPACAERFDDVQPGPARVPTVRQQQETKSANQTLLVTPSNVPESPPAAPWVNSTNAGPQTAAPAKQGCGPLFWITLIAAILSAICVSAGSGSSDQKRWNEHVKWKSDHNTKTCNSLYPERAADPRWSRCMSVGSSWDTTTGAPTR